MDNLVIWMLLQRIAEKYNLYIVEDLLHRLMELHIKERG